MMCFFFSCQFTYFKLDNSCFRQRQWDYGAVHPNNKHKMSMSRKFCSFGKRFSHLHMSRGIWETVARYIEPPLREQLQAWCPEKILKWLFFTFVECVKRKEKNPATANPSNKIPLLITSLTTSRPREGARTQQPKTVTTATGHQGLTTTPKEKAPDSYTTRIGKAS